MDNKEIQIIIGPDGEVKIDMIGYSGDVCQADMKKIVRALGDIVQNKKKAEYFEENHVKISHTE